MTKDREKATRERQEPQAIKEASLTENERKLIEDTIQRHRSTLEELSKR